MFKLACPSCGAEVAFRSATSAMAVCEYCRSTLLREGEAVRDAGKMAVVLEDYSPIRITTSGMYAGQAFGVVGRIQLRYEDGFWNEWYILFDDGSAGWLSDASGQYAVTLDTGLADDAPPFGQIVPGDLGGAGPEPAGTWVDATFGRGGHSRRILLRLGPQGRLVAFDKDPEAIHEATRAKAA